MWQSCKWMWVGSAFDSLGEPTLSGQSAIKVRDKRGEGRCRVSCHGSGLGEGCSKRRGRPEVKADYEKVNVKENVVERRWSVCRAMEA